MEERVRCVDCVYSIDFTITWWGYLANKCSATIVTGVYYTKSLDKDICNSYKPKKHKAKIQSTEA